MFKRFWNYLKTLFRVKAEAAMDPEIEIEQAIAEAREQMRELIECGDLDHDETTAPEPHTGFQGEGGACRHQGRSNADPAC